MEQKGVQRNKVDKESCSPVASVCGLRQWRVRVRRGDGKRESGHEFMKWSGEGCICLWARKCTANPFQTQLPNVCQSLAALLLLANKTDNLPILDSKLHLKPC